MSSHHTIRENQEPAVFLLEVEAISSEVLGHLLEWSPLFISSQECLAWVLQQGLKIDGVITKHEQQDDLQRLLSHQLPIHFIIEKETSLHSGLAYIQSTQNPSCYLFADWNDYLPLVQEGFLFTTKITWIKGLQQAFLLKDRAYSKWYSAGTAIEIIPVDTTGEISINEEKRLLKERLFLKIEENQLLKIQFKGVFFLVEPLA